jgi:hypothetical protein
MRQVSLGVAVAALVGLAACQQKDARHDDLSADLANVTSHNDLALAPNGAARTTVSAMEQVTPHFQVAKSRRGMPHRTPHLDRTSPTVAEVSAPVMAQPVATPPAVEAPVAVVAPRPHPVDASSANTGSAAGGGYGGDEPDGGYGSRGRGGWGGVIIRGGVGDGDHCDPRRGRETPVYGGGRVVPTIRY